MKAEACLFRFLFSSQTRKFDFCNYYHQTSPYIKPTFFYTTSSFPKSSPDLDERVPAVVEEVAGLSKSAVQILEEWGCSESDLAKIFHRQPSLRNAVGTLLESKLNLLSELGIKSSDLVKMISCRPRFLSCRLNRYFDQRLVELQSLFGSKEVFLKAIIRNPSFLVYDFHKTVKPIISLYGQMGLSREDLISMLLLRPTLVPRTHMNEEKLEYIRRTGVTKESKMYKYVVTIIGVSRLETIQEKVANLEKFGFSEDNILKLFGKFPMLMTLSVDKVQRNMTFVVGTMKLPTKSIADHPFLLYASLEDILKPRVSLAGKIHEMDLRPQIKGPKIMTALRMPEKRFLGTFIMCHEKDVREELLDFYQTTKGVRRLGESARVTTFTKGFPF